LVNSSIIGLTVRRVFRPDNARAAE
jgi:hypothetical protein